MTTFTENTIVYFDGYKMFHSLDGTCMNVKYHLNFPDEWISNELPNTGRQCCNCVGNGDNMGYAMWRGIVIGYCCNCSEEYNGTRGPGFVGRAVELYKNNTSSAYDRYLGKVDLETLGDIDANPEDTMENHRVLSYELKIENDIREKEIYNEIFAHANENDRDSSDENDLHCIKSDCKKHAVLFSMYCDVHSI